LFVPVDKVSLSYYFVTAGNRHTQNSRFCKEIREDNFRFWWRRVPEDASQGKNIRYNGQKKDRQYNDQKKKDRQYNDQEKKGRKDNGQKKKDIQHNDQKKKDEDASQGMYMSKIEICFFTARILQKQRMLCCGECFHD
jgi:hypothetical protein